MSRAHLVALGLCLALVLGASESAAEDSVDRAAGQLKNGEDFRVRTQAALALGASKSKRAIDPLCKGLDDSSTTVRAAAAAALGKLKLGGEDCLKKRLQDESSETVKSSIKKALTYVKGGGEPAITSSTKVYLAIAKVVDKTGRSGDGEVDAIVRKAMTKAAGSLEGYVVAPKDETSDQANKRIKKFKGLKSFYLAAKVFEPTYAGGSLQVKVDVAFFTYPGKALKGNVPIKLTQQGVSSKDRSSEDELIQMAAERAVEKFAKNVDRIQ